MELKGKKIAFLGDSITQGVGVADKENVVAAERDRLAKLKERLAKLEESIAAMK